jgi:hypothetical protein
VFFPFYTCPEYFMKKWWHSRNGNPLAPSNGASRSHNWQIPSVLRTALEDADQLPVVDDVGNI